MNEAFWTTLAATLAGGAVSVITALLTAEYSLRRLKAEEDRADMRDERNFQREREKESERMRTEPINQEIAALEAFSDAASRYYVLVTTLGRQNAETTAAGIEFARLSGVAYRYSDVVEHIESFKDDLDATELQDLMEAIGKVISKRREELGARRSTRLNLSLQ